MTDLPAEFLERVRRLETAYCSESDPIRQSGYAGGPARWRAEREPILDAVRDDGDLLDVGCANGYLLECLVRWGAERGHRLTPHGVDIGPRLIGLARARLPAFAANFHVADAWAWQPPRRYRYVYALYDCVPESHFGEYCHRLVGRAVEPGGRLIVGAYGSRSRHLDPPDLGDWLRQLGFTCAGTSCGGKPVVSCFAWVDA